MHSTDSVGGLRRFGRYYTDADLTDWHASIIYGCRRPVASLDIVIHAMLRSDTELLMMKTKIKMIKMNLAAAGTPCACSNHDSYLWRPRLLKH